MCSQSSFIERRSGYADESSNYHDYNNRNNNRNINNYINNDNNKT